MPTLSIHTVRRLALARAGLLKPEWTGFPHHARGRGRRAREAAHAVIGRFGYLQLDTVSIAGARSHVIVLLSRLRGFPAALGEALLQPGEPLFEYWGHEASWIPIDLYPVFGFRRREFRHHPWWGDLVGRHPQVARDIRRRIRQEGPLRSSDLEGGGNRGWWDLKIAKKVASALWSSGELAVSERRNFQRTWDLAERVIPAAMRRRTLARGAALDHLLLKALDGHGWATTGTLVATWRLNNRRIEIAAALQRLERRGQIVVSDLENPAGRATRGWIRPPDLELAARLDRVRPRRDRGVLLSPFDPVLWDRARVRRLFGFDQVLEIFKPAARRIYGYYCLPVLAGDRLVARFDLKAEKKEERLRVLSSRFEEVGADRSVRADRSAAARDAEAARSALQRYADALELELDFDS
jgi:uncharacterized protein YcaQ